MDNPLSDYDLEDFEKIYNQYWEMELDADQFAKNMVSQLISKLDLSIDDAYKLFRFSSYITYYTEQSENIRQLLKRLIDVIKNMKKQGIEYNDIQDHPMIKPMLSKLQNFL
jgi:effector-binding domain-containing protein